MRLRGTVARDPHDTVGVPGARDRDVHLGRSVRGRPRPACSGTPDSRPRRPATRWAGPRTGGIPSRDVSRTATKPVDTFCTLRLHHARGPVREREARDRRHGRGQDGAERARERRLLAGHAGEREQERHGGGRADCPRSRHGAPPSEGPSYPVAPPSRARARRPRRWRSAVEAAGTARSGRWRRRGGRALSGPRPCPFRWPPSRARSGPSRHGSREDRGDRMIGEVDEALRTLVREAVGSPDVEVVLDAPTKDWAARRNAPDGRRLPVRPARGPAPPHARLPGEPRRGQGQRTGSSRRGTSGSPTW